MHHHLPSLSLRRPSTDVPNLDAQDIELLALVAQRCISKGWTRAADAVLEAVVQPQSVMARVSAADAQEVRLAQHQIVVDAAVGKGLEAE